MDKSKPLISIVIPVYNVETFLPKLMNTVAEQSYENIEIILVDDGSTDQSGRICDDWAKNDSRVVVIHKRNGGLSEARNTGVRKSSGEYITFVDSDDYIASDYVEYLWEILSANQADIACANFQPVYGQNDCFINRKSDKQKVFDNIQGCNESLQLKSIQLTVACGKLYKRALVEQNQFPVGRYHEDEATVYKLFYSANKIVVGTKKVYGYYQNNKSSITASRSLKKVEDAIWALEERCLFFKNKGEMELYKLSIRPYVVLLINESACGNMECKRKLEQFSVNEILQSKSSIKLKVQYMFYALTGKSLNHVLHWEKIRNIFTRIRK